MTRNTRNLSSRLGRALALAMLGVAPLAMAQGGAPVLDPRDTQGYHEGNAQQVPGQRQPAQVWNPSTGRRGGDPIAVPRQPQRELQQYYEAQDAQRTRGWNRNRDDRRRHRRD